MRYQQAWSSMQWDKLPTVTRYVYLLLPGMFTCLLTYLLTVT